MKVERLPDGNFLVFDAPALLDWCAIRILHVVTGEAWRREGAQALGVSDGRDIIATMVIHGYEPLVGNAQLSFAATTPRWATRSTIAKLLSYPFGQLGCQRLTPLTPARNRRALRFNEGIGFKREGIARRGFGTDDCVIMGLLEEERPAWARLAPTH